MAGRHETGPLSPGIRAVILAGGAGTRLRCVWPGLPKPMAPVAGRPFIDFVLEYLARQGVDDFVISTGYLGDRIESHFAAARPGARVRCVREPGPMGTGGALAFVLSTVEQDGYFLAVNGDSIAAFRVGDLLAAVRNGADAAMVALQVTDTGRFGSLRVGDAGLLAGFHEKSAAGSPGLINAGIYLFQPYLFPAGKDLRPAPIETDYFPRWLAEGRRIVVVPSAGPFIDIGTPESLAEAESFVRACGLFPGLQ